MVQNNWYALFVMTGQEDKVKERLLYKFNDRLRILVPKRKLRERKGSMWHDIIRTLFPGYVLINGELSSEDISLFKNVPGLIKLLKSGTMPLMIEPEEIEIILRLICNDETIGFSDVLIENGRVVVVDGPLVSMEGLIESIDRRKGRARIQLNFMGEPRTVDLGISILQPAE